MFSCGHLGPDYYVTGQTMFRLYCCVPVRNSICNLVNPWESCPMNIIINIGNHSNEYSKKHSKILLLLCSPAAAGKHSTPASLNQPHQPLQPTTMLITWCTSQGHETSKGGPPYSRADHYHRGVMVRMIVISVR